MNAASAVAIVSTIVTTASKAVAAEVPREPTVTYACGTKLGAGAWVSETGMMKCEGGRGAEKIEAVPGGPNVLCTYLASCLPLTPAIRKKVLGAYNERAFKRLDDILDMPAEAINQTMLSLYESQKESFPVTRAEQRDFTVQCVGSRMDGQPRCPEVNDCINNRGPSSIAWEYRPYNQKTDTMGADSKESRFRHTPGQPPRLVDPPNRESGVVR